MSLTLVDDFPLYTMHFVASYENAVGLESAPHSFAQAAFSQAMQPWACSLFAALGDEDGRLFGRNFDWDYSPALLLFTDPSDGFASVTMVDIAYLGFEGDEATAVDTLPLVERKSLLNAPFIPFDGMNEHGLAVGMAAVPPGGMQPDPAKPSIDSLRVMREALDHAANVEAALEIFQRYNIDMTGGPPLHYLLADRTGRALLVEYYQGALRVIPNEAAWQQATNFLRSAYGASTEGVCERYDTLSRRLTRSSGKLAVQAAVDLLEEVSASGTQWSVVYSMSDGVITIAMGRKYQVPHRFQLDLLGE